MISRPAKTGRAGTMIASIVAALLGLVGGRATAPVAPQAPAVVVAPPVATLPPAEVPTVAVLPPPDPGSGRPLDPPGADGRGGRPTPDRPGAVADEPAPAVAPATAATPDWRHWYDPSEGRVRPVWGTIDPSGVVRFDPSDPMNEHLARAGR